MACPHHAIHAENGKVVTDLTLCDACGTCTDYCNQNLREIIGKEYTVDELVKELKKTRCSMKSPAAALLCPAAKL